MRSIGWLALAVRALGCTKEEPPPPSGDDDDTTPASHTGHTGTAPVEVPDLSQHGIYGVTRTDGTYTSGACTSPTALYVPDGVAIDDLVVIAHNILRDQEAFVDLADHLASWGVPVLTANLCGNGLTGVDPVLDGADLAALAAGTGATRHVYVGHVTGALRALLAANQDPDAVAVVGMDLVDEPPGYVGAAAAAAATVPVLGLQGMVYNCNADGAGEALYDAMPDAILLHVVSADTCDFEWPTSDTCRVFCARPQEEGRGEAAVQRVVRGLVTAAALWKLEREPLGAEYWESGGRQLALFVANGAVTQR